MFKFENSAINHAYNDLKENEQKLRNEGRKFNN